MLKRNEGESLSSASASSVSSQIQSDASEQMDTPVTDLQAVSSDSEVEIANAALNLTADVPCHDDTDSDYHSEVMLMITSFSEILLYAFELV